MTTQSPPPPPPPFRAGPGPIPPKQGRGCWFYGLLVAGILILTIVTTAVVTTWWIKRSLQPRAIEPVVLSEQENEALDIKLERVRGDPVEPPVEPPAQPAGEVVLRSTPGIENEEDFDRKPLVFSEREINALIARNTDLAERVKVRLRRDRVQILGNFPVPEDAPFLGGRTIRINILTRVLAVDGRMEIRLENLALGGVPLPNAWLGDLKGKDLAVEVFNDPDLSSAFSEGIEQLQVVDEEIRILLAE